MSNLIDHAQNVLHRADLLGRGLLVAVSGGVDSVCLLRLLSAVRDVHGGRLEVAHVDHGLRLGSLADAAFCRGLAREFELPFHLRQLDPEALRQGAGVQAEARRERQAFFEGLCLRRRLDAVALGHHADDQVETVLFRLIRGTGLRGVSGMTEWQSPYVRPLLGVRKVEIERLAAERRWPRREDPTNRQMHYARNRVRHEALPLLRSIHPGADDALLRFARLADEDDQLLSRMAQQALETAAVPEAEGLRIPVRRLRDLPAPLRRRLYLAGWERVGCGASRFEFNHLETIDGLTTPGRAHRVAPVPGPGSFARSYGDLWILAPGAIDPPQIQVRLRSPGHASETGAGPVVVWGRDPQAGAPRVGVASGRGRDGLVVRTWVAGDRVDPGTGRVKKVKDILMEAKLPFWRRRRGLVVADERGPLGLLTPTRSWGHDVGDNGWVWLAR